MALFSLIAKQIPKLWKAGLGKGEIRKRISEMPDFANNYSAFFKTRKTPGGSDYGTTFNKAWDSLKLPAVDPTVSGLKGGEKILDPITGKLIRGFSEETRGKLSKSQLNQIKKSIETGISSNNPTVRTMVDFIKSGRVSEGSSAYSRAQERFAKEWGGSLKNLRSNPSFLQAWHTRRAEAQALDKELISNLTPARKILNKYGQDPEWEDIVKSRQDWTDIITPGRKTYYEPLAKEFERQGITSLGKFSAKNPYLAGIAHQLGINKPLKLFKDITPRNMTTKEMIQTVNDPANIGVEYNFMNPSMGALQNFFSKPNDISKLGRLPRMLKDAQVGLKYFDDEGILQAIGMKGRELDPEQMLRYVQYIGDELPFGRTASKRPRYIPIQDYIRALMRGDSRYNFNKGGVVNGYAAGGIGKLGINILKKLAKKMPEEDFLRVMETLWKGVDPKRSGRYKAWAKNRWSPGYKWPYQKSRIKGPEGSPRKHGEPTPRLTSHMADLSPGERVELQSKYADDIWEYKMKKKLGRDLYEDLEYPFLNPENDAFISTAPRTGLGRYQMRHFVDPENVGPVDKYQVYDWWDDVLNKMRKKPKFKYVKDAKGKIVLKEVK